MTPAIGLSLALLFLLGLPIGLIFLVLGLYRRGPANLCACGYDRAGLKAQAPCPECGGPAPTGHDIPRVRWQINVGIALLVLGAGAGLLFLLLLLSRLGGS